VIATLLLAAALAAPPEGAPSLAAAPWVLPPRGAAPLRLQEDWDEDQPQADERHPHVHLSVWGGEAVTNGGSGRSSSFGSVEVAWLFSQVDLGVAVSEYRSFRDATREWTPVFLTRLTQRFKTRAGVEAAFTVGFGAGHPAGWIGWYQLAIGLRVPLGPVFFGGELAFEQYDILRLGAGLGVAF
jgi:hypothetical protein